MCPRGDRRCPHLKATLRLKSTSPSLPRRVMPLFIHFGLALVALASLSLQVAAHGANANASANAFQQHCLSFAPEKLIWNSTRTHLEYVANGTTLEFPDNVASCARPQQLVSADLCRIALSIPTSQRSSIALELWLPEQWSQARYVSTGNGGIDGCSSFWWPESAVADPV